MSKHNSVLRTHNLSVGYGSRVLVQEINLSIAKGEIVGIIGTNGCGKSTLLRTLAGLLPPISGSISMDGKDISKLSAWRRARDYRLAYLPQGSKNFANLTVRENLHLALWHFR